MRRFKRFLLGCLLALPLVSCASSNTPYIGENGNWWVGDSDLGVPAQGTQGSDGKPGSDGKDGKDGKSVTVVSVTFDRTEGNKDYFKIVFSDGTEQFFYTTHGSDGGDGTNGVNGQTPEIKNGTWWIGGIDTGISATGLDGETVNIVSIEKTSSEGLIDTYTVTYSDGNSFRFTVTNGKDGQNGLTPYIGTNGNWWIGDEDTGICAEGQDGQNGLTPYIGDNGNWWIGDEDTGVLADPSKLETYIPTDGLTYVAMTKYGKTGFVVTGYEGTEKEVRIPAYIGTVPVIGIAKDAFYENGWIKSLTAPKTLRFIDQGAFFHCGIESASIESVEEIYAAAFQRCYSLESLSVKSLVSIGSQAFQECTALKTIDFGDEEHLTFIGSNAFYGSGLTSVKIPSSIETIQQYAFRNCASLKRVEFSEDCELSGGSEAFKDCGSLVNLTVPTHTPTWLISGWFTDCPSLQGTELDGLVYFGNTSCPYAALWKPTSKEITTVSIHDDCKTILDEAFSNCKSFTSVSIPSSVEQIGASSFYRCSAMATITFCDDSELTSIGETCFAYCNALTSIAFPTSLSSLQAHAFHECLNLNVVSMDGCKLKAIKGYAFYACRYIESVCIPSTVQTIETNAFYGCTCLTNISFEQGSSLTTIEDYAFWDCSNLSTASASIVLPQSLTTVGEYSFSVSSTSKVFFEGSSDDRNAIQFADNNSWIQNEAKWYYYSETQPSVLGSHWHYVDGVPTMW